MMNAVERLQAAIEKLVTLKVESTPGPWIYGGQGWLFGGKRYTDDELGDLFGELKYLDADGVLIVTLHRTIDAQLAILLFGVKRLTAVQTLTGKHAEAHAHELALADAILGA